MSVPPAVRERIEGDPYAATLGIDLVDLSPGAATTRLTVTDDLLNFHGTPHGGALYSLADVAFAAASNSHGETAVALEVTMSYLEAVETGTTLVARATETHRTDRTAEYEVVVTRAEDAAGSDPGDADEAGPPEDGERDPAGSPGDGGRVATFRGRVYRP